MKTLTVPSMLETRDLYREMMEADRRLEQVVLYGQVVALDAARARA